MLVELKYPGSCTSAFHLSHTQIPRHSQFISQKLKRASPFTGLSTFSPGKMKKQLDFSYCFSRAKTHVGIVAHHFCSKHGNPTSQSPKKTSKQPEYPQQRTNPEKGTPKLDPREAISNARTPNTPNEQTRARKQLDIQERKRKGDGNRYRERRGVT